MAARHADVDRGWAWVVAVAGCLIHIVVGGHRRSMGLFFVELMDYYDRSKSETSVVVSVFYVLSLSSAPVATLLVRRVPVRVVVGCGGVAVSVAFVVAGLVKDFQVAVLTVGVLSGVGNAALHAPTLVLVGVYFERRRTLAVGICLAGGALGSFIFPPLVTLSAEWYGFSGMMLTVSGLSLQTVVFAMLLRSPRPLSVVVEVEETEEKDDANNNEVKKKEEEISLVEETELFERDNEISDTLEKVPLKLSEEEQQKSVNHAPHAVLWRRFKAQTILRRPNFYLYAMAGALATEMLPLALYLIPPMCKDVGIELELQSLILLMMGAPDLLARLGIGLVADRFPKWRVDMFVALLLMKALLWLFVSFSPNFASIMVFAQITGLIGGCIFTLYLPILVDAVGVRSINLIFSVSLVLEGLFCLVFPTLLAYLREKTETWDVSCYVMMCASTLAALLLLHDCYPLRRLRKKSNDNPS